jgi:D-aminopeptidase
VARLNRSAELTAISIDIEGCGSIESVSQIDRASIELKAEARLNRSAELTAISIDIEGCGSIESVSQIDSDVDRYGRIDQGRWIGRALGLNPSVGLFRAVRLDPLD